MSLGRVALLAIGLFACGCSANAGGAEHVAPEHATPKHGTPKSASSTAISTGGFQVYLRGWSMRKNGHREAPLLPGMTLKSGDYFTFLMRIDRPAYVYLLQLGEAGEGELLFASGTSPTRFAADREVRIPTGAGAWLQLDDCPGEERFYVVVSSRLLGPGDTQLDTLVRAAKAPAAQRPCARSSPPRPLSGSPKSPRTRIDEELHAKGGRSVQVAQNGQIVLEWRTDDDGVGLLEFSFTHD